MCPLGTDDKVGIMVSLDFQCHASSATVLVNNRLRYSSSYHYFLESVMITLKTKNCHRATFVVNGGSGSCRCGNRRYRHWEQGWHHDDSWFSVCETTISMKISCVSWLIFTDLRFYWCVCVCVLVYIHVHSNLITRRYIGTWWCIYA